ncbi:MAG: UvrD-helicase domain-containing protein, partial [Pseudomonadota bacterium]
MDAATRAQLVASAPGRSTWLVANAGSGKTRVLTQRVARLLLAGVEPQSILCLTYTKAAASEMQNRLFKTLGAWTMLSDGKLAEALAQLGEPGPFPVETLTASRTLFARAIETPGGLRIQTIHSFCAAILRRFPLEAGVSPDFKEMDERLATLLQREVLEELALAGDPGLEAMAAQQTSDDLGRWLADLLRQRASLSPPKTRDEIWRNFGLPPGYDLDALARDHLRTNDTDTLQAVSTALAGGSANDHRLSIKLGRISLDPATMPALAQLEDALVYGEDSKTNPLGPKSIPTKGGKDALGPALLAAFDDLKERAAGMLPLRRGLLAAEKTAALHAFAASFLPAYEAKKEAGGWLDFDDLIEKTRALLTQSDTAPWVLYKLDGGIDHILVDEAQDTSPAQWAVIRTLSNEFLAGEGVNVERPRTVFVVGDKKQSIYSFQGADPRAFDGMRDHFAAMLEHASEPLQRAKLEFSFRSAPAILGLVDRVFEGAEGLGEAAQHRAFHKALPGRIDLLDPWEKETAERREWYDALDRISEEDHRRKLAQDIAARVERMLAGEVIPIEGGAGSRRIKPSDILILVQSRSIVFEE